MPFVRVWIHLVWSTKNREPMLRSNIRGKAFQHIRENAKEKKIHIDCINGAVDHVHALVLLSADRALSKMVQLIKGESSHWVNNNSLLPFHFEWQEEYFAVSVSESDVEAVRKYIKGQEEHHGKMTFGEEYDILMKKYRF
jgi:REP element-mobilizing transposase RayT